MKVTKCITFSLHRSDLLDSLLDTFRYMCNDAIRIAYDGKPKNRFVLINLCYNKLKQYDLHSHYILSACEVAYSVYKNKNKKKKPYIFKPFLKLDNQSYKLNFMLLKIPLRPRQYIQIPLKPSKHHMQFLSDTTLKAGSITVTENKIVIPFTRQIEPISVQGNMGIDINEKNLTCSQSRTESTLVYKTRSIYDIKQRYRNICADIAKKTHKDNRIKQKLLSKYGRRQRNRVMQRIHNITKNIVYTARKNNLSITMERLTGIRKLYQKGNGKGTSFRFRLNSWSFREFQRQIQYKASWQGIPVQYVNPRRTSKNCSDCNSQLEELENREMLCTKCGKLWDRDVNASLNISSVPLVRAAKPHR